MKIREFRKCRKCKKDQPFVMFSSFSSTCFDCLSIPSSIGSTRSSKAKVTYKKRVCLSCDREFLSTANRICYQCHQNNYDPDLSLSSFITC